MSTSGSTDFTTTRDVLIKNALLQLGAIQADDNPSSDQLTAGAHQLNLIAKAWMADGMPLWAKKETTFSLTGTTDYTVGIGATVNVARPLRIYQATIRDTSVTPNIDLKMSLLTNDEYTALVTKQQVGRPVAFYYDPQGTTGSFGTIHVWPKPDATSIASRVIVINYQRPFEDFDSANDEPDFPQEWHMALQWMLCWALAPQYGITADDRKLWLTEAEYLHQQALSNAMEQGSVFLNPAMSYK